MKKAILAATALIALAACTTTQTTTTPAVPATATTPAQPAVTTTTTTIQSPIDVIVSKLSKLAVPDLQAALADAQKHNDTVAAQCYAGLIPLAGQLQSQSGGVTVPGNLPAPHLFLDFQIVRDAKGQVSSFQLASIRKQINLACGALWVDTQAGVIDPLSLFSGQ